MKTSLTFLNQLKIRQFIFLFTLLFFVNLNSQNNFISTVKTGKVSYISLQYIYVQFENTDGLNVNDSLFLSTKNKNAAALRIKFISEKSVAGEIINQIKLEKGDELIGFAKLKIEKEVISEKDSIRKKEKIIQDFRNTIKERKNYTGRVSVQSASSLINSSNNYDVQRWRYSFSFNADKLFKSDLSFSNYIFFAYNSRDWGIVKSNLGNYLKIYDLAFSYKIDSTNKITAGRSVNRKISNIGAVDGIQYEKTFDNNFGGVIIGSRPDFNDYGFNAKLFQFGGYFGRVDNFNSSLMDNSVGVFLQTNNFVTDRRYIYLQHTNDIIPRTNIFISSEFDLYKKENEVSSNTFSLTSFYVSLRINPAKYLSANISYDARKNIVYYETYKNFIDSLFINELRQGYRINLNIRPISNLNIGLNAGYRIANSDVKPSRNFGFTVNYYSIPFLELSPSISYSKLQSSFIDADNFNFFISKNIIYDASASLGFTKLIYNFSNILEGMTQNIISFDISFLVFANFNFSFNYEGVFEKSSTFTRFFVDLTFRF